jgi:hypothetical protein
MQALAAAHMQQMEAAKKRAAEKQEAARRLAKEAVELEAMAAAAEEQALVLSAIEIQSRFRQRRMRRTVLAARGLERATRHVEQQQAV